jgi:uncharacterized membrane protein YhiD involved in acid resistance
MTTQLTWQAAVLRLALTVIAGALIGLNRSERGRPAGVRTVILVSLAACVSMLQVNALLTLSGKDPTSFIVMDLMRLPLGIQGITELVQRVLASALLEASYQSGTFGGAGPVELQYVVRWRGQPMTREPSNVLAQLQAHPGVRSVRWRVERDEETTG